MFKKREVEATIYMVTDRFAIAETKHGKLFFIKNYNKYNLVEGEKVLITI